MQANGGAGAVHLDFRCQGLGVDVGLGVFDDSHDIKMDLGRLGEIIVRVAKK